MNGRLPLVSVLILSVLAACAVRASAGQVIPIDVMFVLYV
jgi:hypothetical protein